MPAPLPAPYKREETVVSFATIRHVAGGNREMAFKRFLKWGLPLILTLAAPLPASAVVQYRRLSALQTISPTAAPSAREAVNVRLVNEGDPGPLYECDQAVCGPARTDDPSRKNHGRMDFYVLPEGCVELRSALLRREGPVVDVECGPEGGSTIYRCEAGVCDPLGAGDGGAGTWPILLPEDCGGRIHEMIVLGVRRATPKVYVECDASSGPVGEP
jgi:hypothetical protein